MGECQPFTRGRCGSFRQRGVSLHGVPSPGNRVPKNEWLGPSSPSQPGICNSCLKRWPQPISSFIVCYFSPPNKSPETNHSSRHTLLCSLRYCSFRTRLSPENRCGALPTGKSRSCSLSFRREKEGNTSLRSRWSPFWGLHFKGSLFLFSNRNQSKIWDIFTVSLFHCFYFPVSLQ